MDSIGKLAVAFTAGLGSVLGNAAMVSIALFGWQPPDHTVAFMAAVGLALGSSARLVTIAHE